MTPNQGIALALSGGGYRAAAFHLGVLRKLAEDDALEQVEYLSTVSGGSLLAALVFRYGMKHWPSSAEFLSTVHPNVSTALQKTNIERAFVQECLRIDNVLNLASRANLFAKAIAETFELRLQLGELPGYPGWEINATSVGSGKRWAFRIDGLRDRPCIQGDGVRRDAKTVWLADALAASAAFPGLSGPLEHPLVPSQHKIAPDGYTPPNWHTNVARRQLADGGLYDNLGMTAVYDVQANRLRLKAAATLEYSQMAAHQ